MTMRLDIASPKEVSFSEDVVMAVMPGSEGDIAAQPDHAPAMISLRPGVISIQQEGKLVPSYFISGGFADIGPELTTILADDIRHISELSAEDANERLKRAMEDMTAVVNTPIPDECTRAVQVAQAELDAIKHHENSK